MSRRHALPARWPEMWLFTDARLGAALYEIVARLPKGRAGVVYRWGDEKRLRAICKARRLMFVTETDPRIGKAHNRRELVAARRRGAELVFVSPVFPTRTHPEARPLGRARFGLLTRGAGVAVAALGGVGARKYRTLVPLGATAWGGIDAFRR